MDDVSPVKRILGMLGLLAFYAMFIAVFAWMFHAWWPLWVFAWLVVGKAVWIFISPLDRGEEMNRQIGAWAFSVAAYLAAVFAGVFLPLPELGITADIVPALGLPSGGGEWLERPHTAVAGMAFYYLAVAAFKFWRGGKA